MNARPLHESDPCAHPLPGRTIRVRRRGCEPTEVAGLKAACDALGYWPVEAAWEELVRVMEERAAVDVSA